MFKKNLSSPGHRLFKQARLLLAVVSLLLAGCQTSHPLPRVDLKDPAWTVRYGQAVWSRGKGAPEIAGELLLATQSDGTCFVQFTKNPFPLLVAFQTPSRWFLEIPTRNQRYSGPGKPPKGLVWLWLPRLLAGAPPPKHWTWTPQAGQWRLITPGGESIGGFLEP